MEHFYNISVYFFTCGSVVFFGGNVLFCLCFMSTSCQRSPECHLVGPNRKALTTLHCSEGFWCFGVVRLSGDTPDWLSICFFSNFGNN